MTPVATGVHCPACKSYFGTAADFRAHLSDCRDNDPPDVMTPAMMRAVPNTPGTPRRTIRVPDALWDAAAVKAAERDESLSDVIRKALERYVKRR